MAFELISPHCTTFIDHHEELLFEIPRAAGVATPALDRLWEQFYDGPRHSPEQAAALAADLRGLLTALEQEPELVSTTWTSMPPAYRTHFRMPDIDSLKAKLVALIAVCDDGAPSSEGLASLSD